MLNDVQLSPAKLPHDFLRRFPDSLLSSQVFIPPEVEIHRLRNVEWARSPFFILRASIVTECYAQKLRPVIADLTFEFRPHLTTAECLLRSIADGHGEGLGSVLCPKRTHGIRFQYSV